VLANEGRQGVQIRATLDVSGQGQKWSGQELMRIASSHPDPYGSDVDPKHDPGRSRSGAGVSHRGFPLIALIKGWPVRPDLG
jgi:hypothetical protein